MSAASRCPQCGAELSADSPGGLCPACLLKGGFESDAEEDSASRSPTVVGAGFVPPQPQELARYFPQLEILELIGKGGMGAVYKARQPGLDRVVALKILPPEVGRDPAFAERFTREARSLARLNHQNIVAVYDFGQADAYYYFVMEYVDGANLRQLIKQGELRPAEAVAIVPQICEALEFAHEEGIVHRDVKPENILVDKRGRVKIADFGLAKLLRAQPVDISLTKSHQVMGTWHYMAPEQMEHPLEVDHRADIYSLGVVFYEMLTGRLPVGHFDPPSKSARVDVRLDEVVLRALERDPERRYQHASDVKSEVETIALSSSPSAAIPTGEPQQPRMDIRGYPSAATASEREEIDSQQLESVRRQVRGPAIGLLVTGSVNVLAVLVPCLVAPLIWLLTPAPPEPPAEAEPPMRLQSGLEAAPPPVAVSVPSSSFVHQPVAPSSRVPAMLLGHLTKPPIGMFAPGPMELVILLPLFPLTIVILAGGWNMLKVRSFPLAIAGSVAALLPCTPAFLIGLPVGIWALVVLMRPQVKRAFEQSPDLPLRRESTLGVGEGTVGAAVSSEPAEATGQEQDVAEEPGRAGPDRLGTSRLSERLNVDAESVEPESVGAESVESARGQVRGPATALLVLGILYLLPILACPLAVLAVIPYWTVQYEPAGPPPASRTGEYREELNRPELLPATPVQQQPPDARAPERSPVEAINPVPVEEAEGTDSSSSLGQPSAWYVRGIRPADEPPLAVVRNATEPAVPVATLATLPMPPLAQAQSAGAGVTLWLALPILLSVVFSLPLSLLLIIGSIKMKNLDSYGLAVTGAVAAMLPCSPGFLIGLPVGLWALIVLMRPEVKEAFGSRPRHRAASKAARADVQDGGVRGPAIGLIVTGILDWIAIPAVGLTLLYRITARSTLAPDFPPIVAVGLLALVFSTLIIAAGMLMKRRRGYWLCILGSVVAMLVTPGNIVGLPVGIWALVVLSGKEARAAFGRTKTSGHQPPLTSGGEPNAATNIRGYSSVSSESAGSQGARPAGFEERMPSATTIVSRVWHDSWSQRGRWTANTIKAVLVVLYLLGLFTFFTMHGSGRAEEFRHTIGAPTPWFVIDKDPGGFRWHIRLDSWAWLAAIGAFVCYFAYYRIKLAEGTPLRRLDLPQAQVVLWVIVAAAAIGISMTPLFL